MTSQIPTQRRLRQAAVFLSIFLSIALLSQPIDARASCLHDTSTCQNVRMGKEIRGKINALLGLKDHNRNQINDAWEHLRELDAKEIDADHDTYTTLEEYYLFQDPKSPEAKTDTDSFVSRLTGADLATSLFELKYLDPDTRIVSKDMYLFGRTMPKFMVHALLYDRKGHVEEIGSSIADINGRFMITPKESYTSGEYHLVFFGFDPKGALRFESPVFTLHMDSDSPGSEKVLAVSRVDDVQIDTAKVLRVHSKKPVISGSIREDWKPTAEFHSIITASTQVADTGVGLFALAPQQELTLGDHHAYVVAKNESDGAVFFAKPVNFRVETRGKELTAQVMSAVEGAEYVPLGFALTTIMGIFGWGLMVVIDRKKKRKVAITCETECELP